MTGDENFDITTSGGRLIFHIIAVLAAFIRGSIVVGTREGLVAAAHQLPARGSPAIAPLARDPDGTITNTNDSQELYAVADRGGGVRPASGAYL